MFRPGYPAVFSEDRGYRYVLWRDLRPEKKLILGTPKIINFLCLNPSTADEKRDDPTLSKIQGYGKRLDFDFAVVTNLFGIRATKPADMRRSRDPIGPENDRWILELARTSSKVVCAWGNHGDYRGRGGQVVDMLLQHDVSLHVFGFTNSRQPYHPLMLPYSLPLIPWNGES